MCGDLALSLGGWKKILVAISFRMTFLGKTFFDTRQFLMTVFSRFLGFSWYLFSKIGTTLPVDPFLVQKLLVHNPKLLLETSFLRSSYLASQPVTVFLEILGGQMHGPSLPQILGDRSPSPPKVSARGLKYEGLH